MPNTSTPMDNKDYEDALAWLTEGMEALEFDPATQSEMISEYKDNTRIVGYAKRYHYFSEALVVLDNWTR